MRKDEPLRAVIYARRQAAREAFKSDRAWKVYIERLARELNASSRPKDERAALAKSLREARDPVARRAALSAALDALEAEDARRFAARR